MEEKANLESIFHWKSYLGKYKKINQPLVVSRSSLPCAEDGGTCHKELGGLKPE